MAASDGGCPSMQRSWGGGAPGDDINPGNGLGVLTWRRKGATDRMSLDSPEAGLGRH